MPKNSALTTLQRTLSLTAQHYATSTIWLGFSGGLDSTVLLHAVSQHPDFAHRSVHAIHVNHGLSSQADQWQAHCQKQTQQYGIHIQTVALQTKPEAGESVEAWAREQRYQAYAGKLAPGDVILLAHHADDQAETVLYRLCQGHGPKGLSGMPSAREFADQRCLHRPFLSISRTVLETYAKTYELKWIEDESNADQRWSRNYLRHQVMPQLRERWPNVSAHIANTAILCGEAAEHMESWATKVLHSADALGSTILDIEVLQPHKPAQQRLLLRHWLYMQLSQYPSNYTIQVIQHTVIPARQDAQPCVVIGDYQVRRFQNKLYWIATRDLEPIVIDQPIAWDGLQPLVLPHNLGTITREQLHTQGLKLDALDWQQVSIRFRQGGERCQPHGRTHTQSLKKLMQDYKIPPWQRDRMPLLFCGDSFVMAIGGWICHGFSRWLK